MAKFIVGDDEYEIAVNKLSFADKRLLQQVTNMKYMELAQDLSMLGPDGLQSFLWLAMRKNGRHVPYEELAELEGVQVSFDEVDPTKASPETTRDASSRPTGSKSGPRTKPN